MLQTGCSFEELFFVHEKRLLNNVWVMPNLCLTVYMDLNAIKPVLEGGCEQHRCRPACASAQSGQRLCYSRFRR